ncbi:hypothetical protein DL96DRAFT_1552981 [Flagelloscypha sp. PMI_526]|nr:hypothetical protein DL96DRAFT_1552981 [Flagelloscypha sp. PMI_526]
MASAIPPEILLRVFLIYRDDILDHLSRAHRLHDWEIIRSFDGDCPVLWLTPSAVCARWRTVALGCTTLWNIIHLNNVPATRELLRRSGSAPLFVGPQELVRHYLSAEASSIFEACLALTLEHSQRIQSLDLTPFQSLFWSSPPTELLRAMEAATFPSLQVLKVSFENPYFASGFGKAVVRQWLISTVQNILSSYSLTELHLVPAAFPLTPHIRLISLRCLVLGDTNMKLCCQDVKSILRQVHQLESFALYIDDHHSCYRNDTENIVLPGLRELKLQGSPQPIIHFLTFITVQQVTALAIRTSDHRCKRDDCSSVLNVMDALSSWLNNFPDFRSFSCELWRNYTRIHLSSSLVLPFGVDPFMACCEPSDEREISSLSIPDDYNFTLCFCTDSFAQDDTQDDIEEDIPEEASALHAHRDIIQKIEHRLQSTMSAHFHLNGPSSSATLWIQMASRLAEVETLAVSFDGNSSSELFGIIFNVLGVPSTFSEDAALHPIPFYHLANLVLYKARFQSTENEADNSSPTDINSQSTEHESDYYIPPYTSDTPCTALSSLLNDRATFAHPILQLALKDCLGVTKDFVKSQLAPLAETVLSTREQDSKEMIWAIRRWTKERT